MMNVWIKRFKNKVFTYEISKNAIFRLNPMIVEVIEDNKNHTIIDLDILTKNSLINLACLIDEINHDQSKRYYGRLRSYYKNKELSSFLRNIKSIQINCGDDDRDIPEEHIVLKILYEV